METTTKTQGTPGWDRYFHMTERGSNLGTEVRGGIVTFVTMAYIVVLNPLIVGTAKDINGNFPGGGQDIGEAISLVAAATALVAGIMTIFMGVLGRFPIAIAAGLGLNGFLAFGLAFEVPVAVVVLARMGVVSVQKLKDFRGYFVVLAFVIAAVVTPPDVVSQLALAIPMCLLYELGIWAAQIFIKHTQPPQEPEVAS